MRTDLSTLNTLIAEIERDREELNNKEQEVISGLRVLAKSLGFELVPRSRGRTRGVRSDQPVRESARNGINEVYSALTNNPQSVRELLRTTSMGAKGIRSALEALKNKVVREGAGMKGDPVTYRKNNIISVTKIQARRPVHERTYRSRYSCSRSGCGWRTPTTVRGFKAAQALGAHVSSKHKRRAA